eukprot:CAMPEP_0197035848 /NCGR_PEP_ID=MMETSP1384-20130603/13524_1 /TAXON_ID=29189 /ORGANISM="Ammonia sp." /LENGTH=267 /DNA_ID=CAMNT_0042465949 /DNA_START=14 /DNA_END=817 /DNA_ORIENTATION=+
MATAGDANIFTMSVRNPWAYLIAKGYKKVENRHTGMSSDKLNQPIALHVANKSYPQSERHEYYRLPVVAQCLSVDEHTKSICHDSSKLDAFFEQLSGCIIAVIYIEKTLKSNSNLKQIAKYSFADIPRPSKYYWLIAKALYLPEPIANFSGCLGVRCITDQRVLAILRQYLYVMEETEQKKQHLFVPSDVLQNAIALLRADGFRMIYDSDPEQHGDADVEDIDEAETESEEEDANKENGSMQANMTAIINTDPIEQYIAMILNTCNK